MPLAAQVDVPTTWIFALTADGDLRKRFGYTGQLPNAAVYAGLKERGSTLLELPAGRAVDFVIDNLVIDSYESFVHACAKLATTEVDSKGRKVVRVYCRADGKTSLLAIEPKSRDSPIVEQKPRDTASPLDPGSADDAVGLLFPAKFTPRISTLRSASSVSASHTEPEFRKPAALSCDSDVADVAARGAASSAEFTTEARGSCPAGPPTWRPTQTSDLILGDGTSEREPCHKQTVHMRLTGAPAAVLSSTSEDSIAIVKGMLDHFLADLNDMLGSPAVKSALGNDRFEIVHYKGKHSENREEDATAKMPGAFIDNETVAASAQDGRRSAHPGVLCDGCDGQIRGWRHKCMQCCNYDLCHACFKTDRFRFPHKSSHATRSLAPPGLTQPRPQATPVFHGATCDICTMSIIGTRFRCASCVDFDACQLCYSSSIETVHPIHAFIPIADREVSEKLNAAGSTPPARVPHKGVTCDSCHKLIIGIRYKCTHDECPDYDLCATCEALPIPQHNRSHNLLKIRVPAKSDVLEHSIAVARSLTAHGELREAPTGEKVVDVDVDLGSDAAMQGLPKLIHVPIKTSNTEASITATPEFARLSVQSVTSDTLKQVHSFTEQLGRVIEQGAETLKSTVDQQPVNPVSTSISSLLSELVGVKDVIRSERNRLFSEFQNLLVNHQPEASSNVSCEKPIQHEVSVDKGKVSELQTNSEQPVSPVKSYDVAYKSIDLFDAKFLADVTISDGAVLPPAAQFDKTWLIHNTGGMPWPKDVSLQHVGGWQPSSDLSFNLAGPAGVNDAVEVTLRDVRAPEEVGTFIAFYRLVLPDGVPFGDRLWVEICVEDNKDGSRSASSLSASNIVVPAPNSVPNTQYTASPFATPSESAIDDGFVLLSEDSEHSELDWNEA